MDDELSLATTSPVVNRGGADWHPENEGAAPGERVNTYLNFQSQAEEAFEFYAKVFETEVTVLSRFSDMPGAGPGELPVDEQNLVMHAQLPILGGHIVMATDMLRSMGHETRIGNNTTISLDVDSREEADRLYEALSEGGPKDRRWPKCLGVRTGVSPSIGTASVGW